MCVFVIEGKMIPAFYISLPVYMYMMKPKDDLFGDYKHTVDSVIRIHSFLLFQLRECVCENILCWKFDITLHDTH